MGESTRRYGGKNEYDWDGKSAGDFFDFFCFKNPIFFEKKKNQGKYAPIQGENTTFPTNDILSSGEVNPGLHVQMRVSILSVSLLLAQGAKQVAVSGLPHP